MCSLCLFHPCLLWREGLTRVKAMKMKVSADKIYYNFSQENPKIKRVFKVSTEVICTLNCVLISVINWEIWKVVVPRYLLTFFNNAGLLFSQVLVVNCQTDMMLLLTRGYAKSRSELLCMVSCETPYRWCLKLLLVITPPNDLHFPIQYSNYLSIFMHHRVISLWKLDVFQDIPVSFPCKSRHLWKRSINIKWL